MEHGWKEGTRGRKWKWQSENEKKEDKRGNEWEGKGGWRRENSGGGGRQLGFMGHWRGMQANQNGFLKKIITDWKERLQKWVGEGLQTGAAVRCHQHTSAHHGNKTFLQNPQWKLQLETEEDLFWDTTTENTLQAGKTPPQTKYTSSTGRHSFPDEPLKPFPEGNQSRCWCKLWNFLKLKLSGAWSLLAQPNPSSAQRGSSGGTYRYTL